MDTQIRQATEQDAKILALLNADVQQLHADAIPDLFKSLSSETFPAEIVQKLIAIPNFLFFIASEDGIDVGYIFAELRQTPEDAIKYAQSALYIHQISVKPAYQQRGHGERLIAAVKAAAQACGIPVTLDVWAFNNKARTFFEKQGFTVFTYHMRMEANV